jgi:hypothetical protein
MSSAPDGQHTSAEALPSDASAPFDSNAADANVILRSSDNVDFRVVKAFLSYSSPIFRDMFSLPRQDEDGSVDDLRDGLPIVLLTEHSDVVYRLLQFCYPACAMIEMAKWDSLQVILALLEPSHKYGMDGVERRAREALISSRFVDAEPLRVFALAIHHKLEPEAKVAAAKTLALPLLGRAYIPELELITGGDYLRLEEYRRACAEVAMAVAKDVEWIERETWIWFDCNGDYCRSVLRNNINPLQVTISRGRCKRVRSMWWDHYMRMASDALLKRPSGTTLTSGDLMDDALAKASLCATCRTRAFAEMREFTTLFAKQVDHATAQVSLVCILQSTILISRADIVGGQIQMTELCEACWAAEPSANSFLVLLRLGVCIEKS